jgi:16S rRNA (guanine966-N2)-methyltransferase
MKIIAGERKGHTLTTPRGTETRPTLTRVRESLFSIIAGDIPGSIFCELFAGAGSIGLEALSRGAASAHFVEVAREPFQCLKQNIEKLRYQDRAKVSQSDAMKWAVPTGASAPDIIFADPPYNPTILEKLVRRLETAQLKPDTLLILQTPAGYKVNSSFQHLRTAVYGSTALHFFLAQDADQQNEALDHPVTESR